MQRLCYRSNRGFTIFELVVAMGLASVILGGALALTSQAIGISDMVSQRSDMQQNARVAINMIARDASLAGTGFPAEGVQLPGGTGSQDSHFACDEATGCHLTTTTSTRTNDCMPPGLDRQAGQPSTEWPPMSSPWSTTTPLQTLISSCLRTWMPTEKRFILTRPPRLPGTTPFSVFRSVM